MNLTTPGEKVLAADASKGIVTTSNQNIQRGFDWVISGYAFYPFLKYLKIKKNTQTFILT